MKAAALLASCLFGLFLAHASAQKEDLSSTFEGNTILRVRLAKLQDNPSPPALQVSDWMNSPALTLDSLRGKVVVLDFWATWCGPCKASVPHTNELARKYDGKAVFIGICASRGSESMAQLVQELGIQYPVAKDVGDAMVKAYAVNSFPDYYIIDQNGKLAVADCANHQVESAIQELLGTGS